MAEPIQSNTLDFSLFLDQTFLPPILEELRKVVQQFPVIAQ